MKVALLISGYLRSFEINLTSLSEKILSKFSNVDIFLHLTKEEKTQDKYLNIISINDIENIKSILKPKVIIEEQNIHFFDEKKKNDIANSWAKFYKLNKIKKEYEETFGRYDIVIKYRPDMNIDSDIDFSVDDDIRIPKESKIDKTKLANENDPHVCDVFAFGKSEQMDLYFSIHEQNKSMLGKYPAVPETLLFHYLKDNGIKYKTIDMDYSIILSSCNVFAICGDSGSGKSTLGELLKTQFSNSFLLECDRYHKWERQDENWSNFTHLNPEANLIVKMKNDIFDLKIGKSVYHVDYDHSTGKFTDKQKIDSSDNIIVCGLHSLYGNNNNLYNISIFMDTDPKLKKKWKIARDIKKRGYTEEQINKQIENRKKDYSEFIEPQRENSDIVINFFEREDNPNEIGLKISIKKKYSILGVLSILSRNKVPFILSSNETTNEITFLEAEESAIFGSYDVPNPFYRYIVFVIMNLIKC